MKPESRRAYRRRKTKELIHEINVLDSKRKVVWDGWFDRLNQTEEFIEENKNQLGEVEIVKWEEFQRLQKDMDEKKNLVASLLQFREENKRTGGMFAKALREKHKS